MHDTILTAMDNVVITRVGMAMKSATESSKWGPSSVVQNLDQKDLAGKTQNTPLIRPLAK